MRDDGRYQATLAIRMLTPPGPWLTRLRHGWTVWLVKEQEYATVLRVFRPTGTCRAGLRQGQIGLQRCCGQQNWFIDEHGDGLDGKPLLAPVEGNLLPDVSQDMKPFDSAHTRLRDLYEELQRQQVRIQRLEQQQGLRPCRYADQIHNDHFASLQPDDHIHGLIGRVLQDLPWSQPADPSRRGL